MRTTLLAAALAVTASSGAAFAASPTTASRTAGGDALTVTASTSAAWADDATVPVAIAVQNTSQRAFCGPMTVTLHWTSAASERRVSAVVSSAAGAGQVVLSVPARSVQTPSFSYWATARQTCGVVTATQYTGRSDRGHVTLVHTPECACRP